MDYMDIAIQRLESLKALVDKLKMSEFPYADSRNAFNSIGRSIDDQLNTSRILQKDLKIQDENRKQHAVATLDIVQMYLPYLGIILRSTNIRNAFELFQPLFRLAAELLDDSPTESGRKINLILSSEWRYSPYIYANPILPLNNFIVIGLPATEAANPLLVPVAGHELGHKIWNVSKLDIELREIMNREIDEALHLQQNNQKQDHYNTSLTDNISKLERKTKIFEIVKHQATEIFCDIIATRLFGPSFPLSLCYLLSPGVRRSKGYPTNKKRLEFINKAEEYFFEDSIIDINYKNFLDDTLYTDSKSDENLKVSDVVVEKLFDTLLKSADKCLKDRYKILNRGKDTKKIIPGPDKSIVLKIYGQFKNAVPSSNPMNLSNIINAGWLAYLDKDLWKSIAAVNDSNRNNILYDLILKNIELLEYETRTGE